MSIFRKFERLPEAIKLAIQLNDIDLVKEIFMACTGRLEIFYCFWLFQEIIISNNKLLSLLFGFLCINVLVLNPLSVINAKEAQYTIFYSVIEWTMYIYDCLFILQSWEKAYSKANGIHVGQAAILPGVRWRHGRLRGYHGNYVQFSFEQQLSKPC